MQNLQRWGKVGTLLAQAKDNPPSLLAQWPAKGSEMPHNWHPHPPHTLLSLLVTGIQRHNTFTHGTSI